jgi:hypothetical protein
MLRSAEAAGLEIEVGVGGRGFVSPAEQPVLPMWPRCYSPTCNHGMEEAADQWERSPCYSPCCTQVCAPGHRQACVTTLRRTLCAIRLLFYHADRCAPQLENCGVLRASVLACVLREQKQPQIVSCVDAVFFDLTCVLRW